MSPGCAESGTVDAITVSGERATVTFYDDAYTTMEFVVDVLRSVFELSQEDAQAATQAVHGHGASRIGVFDTTDARARLARARELAHVKGMPLRIVLTDAE